MRRIVSVVAVAGVLGGAAVASASLRNGHYTTPVTPPLRTAVRDPYLFSSDQKEPAFQLTRAAGSTSVLLSAVWSQLASHRMSGKEAANPDSSGYNWASLDAQVEAAVAAGLTPMLHVSSPPRWALAKHRHGRNGGTPQIAALRQFALGLARHYDGQHGPPAVHAFEVWNEANLSVFLSPPSPVTYRKMVNAVAAGVHSVSRRNLVIAGALDPFQNRTKTWHTVAPLAFMRAFLCVSKGRHPHATCKAQAHFDVWSHHPYTFGGPFGRARLPDDVSLGDLPRMRRLLQAAERLHRIASPHPVQFWVTEFGWDSNPPRKGALRIALQARGTSEALYQMWRSGVSLVTWWLLQDLPLSTPDQSGLYFGGRPIASARAKPTLIAFRFPFVAYLKGNYVQIWGRDTTSSAAPVTIQLRHGKHGSWRTVATIEANRYGIFLAKVRLKATKKDWLRASSSDSGDSLAFSLKQPKYPHIGPWGN